MVAVLQNNEMLFFTTVVQKLNQGVTGNHAVIDCWSLFWYFFGQAKKYKHI